LAGRKQVTRKERGRRLLANKGRDCLGFGLDWPDLKRHTWRPCEDGRFCGLFFLLLFLFFLDLPRGVSRWNSVRQFIKDDFARLNERRKIVVLWDGDTWTVFAGVSGTVTVRSQVWIERRRRLKALAKTLIPICQNADALD
jgi:hypothetical protein